VVCETEEADLFFDSRKGLGHTRHAVIDPTQKSRGDTDGQGRAHTTRIGGKSDVGPKV
jgi:hypothetical protein